MTIKRFYVCEGSECVGPFLSRRGAETYIRLVGAERLKRREPIEILEIEARADEAGAELNWRIWRGDFASRRRSKRKRQANLCSDLMIA